MKIEIQLSDVNEAIEAIDLAIACISLNEANMDDAHPSSESHYSRKCRETLQMMKLAYELIRRNNVNQRYAVKAPHPFKCGCKTCMPLPKRSTLESSPEGIESPTHSYLS